jgi:pilus assembly protein CpaB
MRSKSIILLALALGCGLVASIGISQVMERRQQAPVAQGETEVIFVALHDINPNEPITAQNIKTEEWPQSKVPAGVITKLDEIENMRTRQKIFQGEPLLLGKLIDADDITGASKGIPKGYRVVAVRVNDVSGTGSLILPGDRVDLLVYLTRNPAHDVHEAQTRTVLQDVKVFAVNAAWQRDPGDGESSIAAKTISLLVTPQQAEKVTLASEMGAVRLVLRNDSDSDLSETDGTQASDVLGTGSASDRSAEKEKVEVPQVAASSKIGDATKSLLEFIKERQKSQPVVAPTVHGPWKIKLLKGGLVEEVSIDGEGVPQVLGLGGNLDTDTSTTFDSANSADSTPDSNTATETTNQDSTNDDGSGFNMKPGDPADSLQE